MAAPLANVFGQGGLSVTATATGAVSGSTARVVDVALGLPVVNALEDLAHSFGLRNSLLNNKGRYNYKVTYTYVRSSDGAVTTIDLNLGMTWAQQGVHDTESIVLANYP